MEPAEPKGLRVANCRRPGAGVHLPVSALPPVSFKQLRMQGFIVHDKFQPSKSGKGGAGKLLPSSCQDHPLDFKHSPPLR